MRKTTQTIKQQIQDTIYHIEITYSKESGEELQLDELKIIDSSSNETFVIKDDKNIKEFARLAEEFYGIYKQTERQTIEHFEGK